MSAPLYTAEILRLAASLQGPHELERVDGGADLRSVTCGSRIKIVVQLDRDGRIEKLSQEVHACAFGQASAALVEQHARGRGQKDVSKALLMLSRWLGEGSAGAIEWPGIEVLAPAKTRKARHAAILLPFRALVAAIESAR